MPASQASGAGVGEGGVGCTMVNGNAWRRTVRAPNLSATRQTVNARGSSMVAGVTAKSSASRSRPNHKEKVFAKRNAQHVRIVG